MVNWSSSAGLARGENALNQIEAHIVGPMSTRVAFGTECGGVLWRQTP
jgi:hypothetical protein